MRISPLFARGEGLDTSASAYFAAMTTQPTTARKILINNLIVGLKADGVWNRLDIFYLFASHDAQSAKINAANPGTNNAIATGGGSPTFVTDRGFGGYTGYTLNHTISVNSTGYNWQPNGANGASYGSWRNSMSGGSLWNGDGGSYTFQYCNQGSGYYDSDGDGYDDTYYIYSYVYGSLASTNFSTYASFIRPRVFAVVDRPSPTAIQMWLDGVIGTNYTSGMTYYSSTTPLASVSAYDYGQNAAYFLGAHLTAPQQLAFYNRLNTYLTAIGAN